MTASDDHDTPAMTSTGPDAHTPLLDAARAAPARDRRVAPAAPPDPRGRPPRCPRPRRWSPTAVADSASSRARHDRRLGRGDDRGIRAGSDDPAPRRHGRAAPDRGHRADFASEHDGRMHACGHDTHVAMLMGAARLLVERRADLARPRPADVPARRGGLPRRPVHARGRAPRREPDGERTERRLRPPHLDDVPDRHDRRPARADARRRRHAPRSRSAGRGGHASAPHRALDPDHRRRRDRPRPPDDGHAGGSTCSIRRSSRSPRSTAGTTTNIIPETASSAARCGRCPSATRHGGSRPTSAGSRTGSPPPTGARSRSRSSRATR